MKSNLLTCLSVISYIFTLPVQAQVSLPYYSGFDNAAERSGWAIYRLGEAALGNWSIAGINGFSAPACISHDYSPSSGVNVVDDWYVSPGFLIPSGGMLDSVRYAFSGFSVPTTGDTIGVYMIVGNQDPTLALDIIELTEFRDDRYQTDNVYRLLSGISLPSTSGSVFIGLRYRNAAASSRWLHVRFDNIAVRGMATSVDKPVVQPKLVVYPNPTTDEVTILHDEAGGIVSLYDLSGIRLVQFSLNPGQSSTTLSLRQWPAGLYQVVVVQKNKIERMAIARI